MSFTCLYLLEQLNNFIKYELIEYYFINSLSTFKVDEINKLDN